jgi:hypothetical protein
LKKNAKTNDVSAESSLYWYLSSSTKQWLMVVMKRLF